MKKIIAVLILFAPILSSGQDPTKEQSRFSIGLNFSPNYSYRTLKYSDEWQNFVDSREILEHPSFGFNSGISADYSISERLELELGAQFSRQTHIFKDGPFYDVAGNTSLGLADNESRYHYLEIPSRVNYHLMNNKLLGYIFGGVSANLFLYDKSKSWLTYNDGSTDVVVYESSINDFNKIAVALIGGIGFGYHASEKLNLRLEPLFRYSLTPTADAPIKQHTYSIGCQIGVKMKL